MTLMDHVVGGDLEDYSGTLDTTVVVLALLASVKITGQLVNQLRTWRATALRCLVCLCWRMVEAPTIRLSFSELLALDCKSVLSGIDGTATYEG